MAWSRRRKKRAAAHAQAAGQTLRRGEGAVFVVLFSLLMTILFGSCNKGVPELPAPDSPPKQAAIRVGVDHFSPKRITMLQPRLPEAAKRVGLKGPVVLEVKIDEAGSVADVRVVRGHSTLNSTAEDAVKRWKYEPMSFQGQPVSFWTTVLVNFRNE